MEQIKSAAKVQVESFGVAISIAHCGTQAMQERGV